MFGWEWTKQVEAGVANRLNVLQRNHPRLLHRDVQAGAALHPPPGCEVYRKQQPELPGRRLSIAIPPVRPRSAVIAKMPIRKAVSVQSARVHNKGASPLGNTHKNGLRRTECGEVKDSGQEFGHGEAAERFFNSAPLVPT